MTRILIIYILFLTACSDTHKDNLIIGKIKSNSHLLKDSILSLKGSFDKLPQVDSIVLNSLKKSRLFQPDTCLDSTLSTEGMISNCKFWVYYYGYFDTKATFFSAVFAKSTLTCCGEDELILAHIDKSGNLIDAIAIAEYASESECTRTKSTLFKPNEIKVVFQERCYILTDGENVGDRIDSTNSYYSISSSGQFIFKVSNNFKIDRLDPK